MEPLGEGSGGLMDEGWGSAKLWEGLVGWVRGLLPSQVSRLLGEAWGYLGVGIRPIGRHSK